MVLSFGMIKMASLMYFVTFTCRYIDFEKSTFASIAAFTFALILSIIAVTLGFHTIVI